MRNYQFPSLIIKFVVQNVVQFFKDMAKRKATVSIILDQRTMNDDGQHPIKLRVIHERVNRTYSLKLYLSKEEFSKLNSTKRVNPKVKDAQVICAEYISLAQEIIDGMPEFSFEEFREKLFPTIKEETKEYSKVEVLFREIIADLKKAGRVSTYQSYETTLNSLLAFKKNLKWKDITVGFLNDYEKKSIEKGKSPTTVGIYLRTLRAVYNIAIDKGAANRESYPFGRRKYEIPASRNIKKALSIADIKKIVDYEVLKNEPLDMARDIFVFSYLCNGLNIKDICLLKNQDIDGDTLSFIRAKTSRTKKAGLRPIVVHLNATAKSIITKHRCGGEDCDYLFPFLKPGMTPEQIRARVQNLTKQVNKYMKRIGKELGLGDGIRTYTARHTYSTVLKRSGVSIEYISESLGHADLKTTESYLDSFEDETRKRYSELLL